MNKHLLLCTALLLSSLNQTLAATNISGQIRNNTTWTKAGSPYICTGLIEIAPDASLNLEPGTTVIMDNDMHVYGSLIINGSSTDSVTIKGKANNTLKYSKIQFFQDAFKNTGIDTFKIEYVNLLLTGLWIGKCNVSVDISKCRIEGSHTAIRWSGAHDGCFSMKNNYMSASVDVGVDDRTPSKYINIVNNTFKDAWGSFVIQLRTPADSIIVSNNSFFHGDGAITISDVSNNTHITNNQFHSYKRGIRVLTSYERHISGNIFIENETAIEIFPRSTSPCFIRNNTIQKNKNGIYLYMATGNVAYSLLDSLTIENNCISDNEFGLYWQSPLNYSIGTNWWGTTDTIAIDTCIHDFKADFKLGVVSYSSFLSTDAGCKTYTPPTTNIPKLSNNSATIYPNPFNEVLTFKTDASALPEELSLYNITGTKVASVTNVQNNTITIDTKELPQGLYIYKLTYKDNSTSSGKVLKQ